MSDAASDAEWAILSGLDSPVHRTLDDELVAEGRKRHRFSYVREKPRLRLLLNVRIVAKCLVADNFWVTLPASTYDRNVGWPCSALSVPGAKLADLRVDGATVAPKEYEVSGGYVRLIAPRSTAPDAAARIELTKRLVTIDTAIIVAVIGALATIFAAWIQYSRGFSAASIDVSKNEAVAEQPPDRRQAGFKDTAMRGDPIIVRETGAGGARAAGDNAAQDPVAAGSGGGKQK